MAQDPQTTQLIEASEAQRQKYAEQAKRCQPKFLYKALKLLNQCDVNYRQSSNKRLLVELTLIQVAQITQEDEDDAAGGRRPCKRLKALFRKLMEEAGAANTAPSAVSKGEGQSQGNSVDGAAAAKAEETARQSPKVGAAAIGTAVRQNTAATAKPRVKLKSIGASFHNIMHGDDKETKTEEKVNLGETANEAEPFNDDDVRREWLSMCNRMLLTKQSAHDERATEN